MTAVRMGVIGLGRGAMLTVPGFAEHPRIEIVAGFDPLKQARTAFAEAHGARAHDSLESLLANDAVDAVYIASPHGLHASHAVAAAEAGKHVLVEKPMAVTLADARTMIDAARRGDVHLLVGPSHGFDPPVAYAADLAAQGKYGPARLVHLMAYTDFLYRPRRPEELDRAAGGGVVHSQATHQIDIARRIIGSRIISVRAQSFDWDPTRRSDGAYAAMLFFENGAAASLSYSGYAHFDSDALCGDVAEFGGRKAADVHSSARHALAAVDEPQAKMSRGYRTKLRASPSPIGHDHFGFCLASCAGADIELTATGVIVHGDSGSEAVAIALPPAPRRPVGDMLAAAVLDGVPPLFDGKWGEATLACVLAMLRSAEHNREVTLQEILSDA